MTMESGTEASGPTARLAVISGLPGVGKSAVAQVLAREWSATAVSIDAIEEALLGCGFVAGWQTGVAAYEAARAIAEQNLAAGRAVVVDAVNDSEQARQTWRAAATATDARLHFVCLVMADVGEHRRRLTDRNRGLVHVGEPTWAQVEDRRAGYAPWTDDVLEVDSSAMTAEQIGRSLAATFAGM